MPRRIGIRNGIKEDQLGPCFGQTVHKLQLVMECSIKNWLLVNKLVNKQKRVAGRERGRERERDLVERLKKNGTWNRFKGFCTNCDSNWF